MASQHHHVETGRCWIRTSDPYRVSAVGALSTYRLEQRDTLTTNLDSTRQAENDSGAHCLYLFFASVEVVALGDRRRGVAELFGDHLDRCTRGDRSRGHSVPQPVQRCIRIDPVALLHPDQRMSQGVAVPLPAGIVQEDVTRRIGSPGRSHGCRGQVVSRTDRDDHQSARLKQDDTIGHESDELRTQSETTALVSLDRPQSSVEVNVSPSSMTRFAQPSSGEAKESCDPLEWLIARQGDLLEVFVAQFRATFRLGVANRPEGVPIDPLAVSGPLETGSNAIRFGSTCGDRLPSVIRLDPVAQVERLEISDQHVAELLDEPAEYALTLSVGFVAVESGRLRMTEIDGAEITDASLLHRKSPGVRVTQEASCRAVADNGGATLSLPTIDAAVDRQQALSIHRDQLYCGVFPQRRSVGQL